MSTPLPIWQRSSRPRRAATATPIWPSTASRGAAQIETRSSVALGESSRRQELPCQARAGPWIGRRSLRSTACATRQPEGGTNWFAGRLALGYIPDMAARTQVRSIRKTLPARELPATWPERERFAPDDLVTIWIEPEDEELRRAASLQQVMDIIGERAKARGLTPEKLDAILNDT